MTEEQIKMAKELYRAHFTPKEAKEFLPNGYYSLVNLWASFRTAQIEKYDRFMLIPKWRLNASAQTEQREAC